MNQEEVVLCGSSAYTKKYYLNPDDYTKKADGTASDVSNANFETLLFDPALAAGMTINTYQSALLIQSLGINIH